MENELDLSKYKHFVSIGYFCSVALELERLGLRNESLPFDWVVSRSIQGVLELIDNHFSDYLNYSFLYQSDTQPNHYRNVKYNIDFYHDFDEYHSLEEQLPNVQEKYERRIERFYNIIKEPTLFVRYINSEIDNSELIYLKNNYNCLENTIKMNPENKCILICNSDIDSSFLDVYKVDKDDGDVVSRKPFENNFQLEYMFNNFYYYQRENNIERYLQKQKQKKSNIWLKKIQYHYNRAKYDIYNHSQKYKD